jgi:hypothetical protein
MEYKGYNLERGLWKSPYVRMFYPVGPQRIMEVSNYPRVKEDTDPHVTTKDEIFVVEEGDLYHPVLQKNGLDKFYYMDDEGNMSNIGELAIRPAGSPLPGAFPKWIPIEDEPVVDIDEVPTDGMALASVDEEEFTKLNQNFAGGPRICYILWRKVR